MRNEGKRELLTHRVAAVKSCPAVVIARENALSTTIRGSYKKVADKKEADISTKQERYTETFQNVFFDNISGALGVWCDDFGDDMEL